VVGTLYAVLLGLIVVDALVRFQHAIDIVRRESNAVADVYLLAQKLPEAERTAVQKACKDYARLVVHDEWPLMARGMVSGEARRMAFTLTKSLRDFEPATEAHKAIYPLILEQVREVGDCRRERTGTAQQGIPAVEWFVLVVGGGVTILFGGLFSARNAGLQRLLTALAALLIGLNLYLVALFGYPFAGDVTVSNRPFTIDIAIFEGRFADEPTHPGERLAQ
jgi:hypothetical protein